MHTFSVYEISLFAAMIVTALILVVGVVIMVVGGPLNQKYGSKLMQWRIIAQGVALALFAIVIMRGR